VGKICDFQQITYRTESQKQYKIDTVFMEGESYALYWMMTLSDREFTIPTHVSGTAEDTVYKFIT